MINHYQHLLIQSVKEEGPKELTEVQALVESPLPDEFASFLRAAAGHLIEYEFNLNPAKKRQQPMAFHTVWELGPEPRPATPTTIAGLTLWTRQQKVPKTCIAFAGHPYVAHLFYDVPPRGSGQVFASRSAIEFDRLKPVAATFNDYVNALKLNYSVQLSKLQNVFERGRPQDKVRMREWLDAAVPDWRTRWEVPADVVANLEAASDKI